MHSIFFVDATLATVLLIWKEEVEQLNVNDRLNVQETFSTADWLTQLREHWSTMWWVAGSNPGRTTLGSLNN